MRRFKTVMTLTALLGWLPALLSILAVQVSLAYGAREWDDVTFSVAFVTLYAVLLGIGAYVHTRWFS